jgi:hypothetical protein
VHKHNINSSSHSSPDSKSGGSVLSLNQICAVDVKQVADKEYYAFIDYLTVNEKGKFGLVI